MAAERPAKDVVREMWISKLRGAMELRIDGDQPVLLTLAGAEGHDIQRMIDRGLIETTEVGGIAAHDQNVVVAVENSPTAILALQRKFPGLRIRQSLFSGMLAGDSRIRYPNGKDQTYCRAQVVNLDLNQSLVPRENHGSRYFPIIRWIEKLSELHSVPPIDWTLCLTLHGQIHWDANTSDEAQRFYRENVDRSPELESQLTVLLGQEIHSGIMADTAFDMSSIDRAVQQKILMLMVPKYIVRSVTSAGWRVSTSANLRYGGSSHAPMVTWIFDFQWDDMSVSEPDTLYKQCVGDILTEAGQITEEGDVVFDLIGQIE